jgi:predicted nucleic acid-binding protein
MGILIDSSVLIGIERGQIDLAEMIRGREEEEFYISVITASELLHGVWRAMDADTRTRRSAFVEGVIQQFPILAVDLGVARIHAQITADLRGRGRPIGAQDAWLAATCIARGLTLATANLREFEQVPGLTVEKWG